MPDLEDDVQRAIDAALASGATTSEEIKKFVAERLKPMVHIDVPEPSQQDRDQRRIRFNFTVAHPAGSEH